MRVSVVITAWNAADTLAETLDSVAAQTRLPNEVIVVDDGSTDQTAEVAKNHKLPLQVVSKSNGGMTSAINAGVDAATGDVIAFLDSDDLWLPNKTELQLAFLDENPSVDIVTGHYEAFECPSIPPERFATMDYAKGRQPGYLTGCVMIRKRWLFGAQYRFDEKLKFNGLMDWFIRARDGGAVEKVMPDLVMRRRIRPGTLGSRAAASASKQSFDKDVLEIARRALAMKREAKTEKRN